MEAYDYMRVEVFSAFMQVVIWLFPLSYIAAKKGSNKFLFLLATIGAVFIVQFIITLIAFPFIYVSLFVIPGMYPNGAPDHHIPFLYAIDFVADWWFIILCVASLMAYVYAPIRMYKKYAIFRD